MYHPTIAAFAFLPGCTRHAFSSHQSRSHRSQNQPARTFEHLATARRNAIPQRQPSTQQGRLPLHDLPRVSHRGRSRDCGGIFRTSRGAPPVLHGRHHRSGLQVCPQHYAAQRDHETAGSYRVRIAEQRHASEPTPEAPQVFRQGRHAGHRHAQLGGSHRQLLAQEDHRRPHGRHLPRRVH